MANSNGTAVAAFFAVAMGAWLIDSGIQGRHPISALEDIIKNPSNVKGSLASSKGQFTPVSTLVGATDTTAGNNSAGTASNALPVTTNNAAVNRALNKGLATKTNIVDECLAFVASVYGATSNYASAAAAWASIPAQYEHPGDTNPPPGAWEFFQDGNPGGHVALSLGGGKVESTDYSNGRYMPGVTGVGTIDQVASAMGGTPLGWTDPYAKGVGLLAGNL